MTGVLLLPASLVGLGLLSLLAWRYADKRANRRFWASLSLRQPSSPAIFDPAMVEDMPEPARRFLRYAIRPGTPLKTVVEITMDGDFSLGNKVKPNYLPMAARQILASPYGFVWTLNAGQGLMRISGSDAALDGRSWSRFWLLGIAPVARAGGNPYHLQASFGRYVAEAVFWAPAALLPSRSVRWQQISNSSARVSVTHQGLHQAVDVTVAADGRLSKVAFQRWSNANAAKQYQWQPFGGYLSEFKEFDGFRLPTRIEAGNFFETDNYFPFFRATVRAISFPGQGGD